METKNYSERVKRVLLLATAILSTVQELGEAPSGVMYAALMSQGVSLDEYQQILGMLERIGAVKVTGHLVTPGPKMPDLSGLPKGP